MFAPAGYGAYGAPPGPVHYGTYGYAPPPLMVNETTTFVTLQEKQLLCGIREEYHAMIAWILCLAGCCCGAIPFAFGAVCVRSRNSLARTGGFVCLILLCLGVVYWILVIAGVVNPWWDFVIHTSPNTFPPQLRP